MWGLHRSHAHKVIPDLLLFFFWPYHMAHGILVPRAGIKPKPHALEARSLNHWTTGEVPDLLFLSVSLPSPEDTVSHLSLQYDGYLFSHILGLKVGCYFICSPSQCLCKSLLFYLLCKNLFSFSILLHSTSTLIIAVISQLTHYSFYFTDDFDIWISKFLFTASLASRVSRLRRQTPDRIRLLGSSLGTTTYSYVAMFLNLSFPEFPHL